MKWEEFRDLLVGIAPDTALGRIVSVRAEDRKEYLENFTPEQHRIRNEWKSKHAEFPINYICLFNYLFISSQMSAKPYFIGSTGILLLW